MLNAAVLLSLALLAGRLAGLVRELMLASVFGVSPAADVAVLLLTLPDLLVGLLISGGLSAALVPRLSSLSAHEASALFRQTSIWVVLPFGALALLLVLWPQGLFHVLAPGAIVPFGAGSGAMVALALALPLAACSGVAGAYLNARQRFFITGCGTLLFNGGVIAALALGMGGSQPLVLLAFGIAGGAALRWAAQMAVLPRSVWRRGGAQQIDRTLMSAFATATLAATLMLLAPLLIRALASLLGTGAIASFNYAQKLVELPIAILITAISTVALARLSALQAREGDAARRHAALRDTRYSLLMAVTITLLGCQFADAVVQLLFGRGAMDGQALARVSRLTQVALLGVPFVALSSMAVASLNAAQQTRRILMPTLSAMLGLAVFAVPGLWLQSETGLMGAVVGFQALTALLLARAAGLVLVGPGALVNVRLLGYLAALLGLALLGFGVDHSLSGKLYWRLALAGALFACSLAIVRAFLRRPSLSELHRAT